MFLIYGKPKCPYCEMARNLLLEKGEYFTYYTLDEDFTVAELIETVVAKTGIRPSTFPQIFVRNEEGTDTTHVGGFTQLRDFLAQSGE